MASAFRRTLWRPARTLRSPAEAGRHVPPRIIINEPHAQRNRQQVEEREIAGQRDDCLESRQQRGAGETKTPRSDDEEWRDEFDRQRRGRRHLVERDRQVMCVEGDRVGNRLRLVVERERCQIPPGRIAARQLDGARPEDQPEQQP